MENNKVDRRDFNKIASATFGMLALPGGITEPVDLRQGDVGSMLGYSVDNIEINTTLDLENIVFTSGGLDIYEDFEKKPNIEVDISFRPSLNKPIERTVYFQGDNKKWHQCQRPVSTRECHSLNPATKISLYFQEVKTGSPGFYDKKRIETKTRYFRNMCDPSIGAAFAVFKVGTKERVRLDEIVLDEFYDLEARFEDSSDKSIAVISMQNFKAIYLEDFDENENHF